MNCSACDSLSALAEELRSDPGRGEGLEADLRAARAALGQVGLAEAALALAVFRHEHHDPAAALVALAEAEVASNHEGHLLIVELLKLKVLVVLGNSAASIRTGRDALARARRLGDQRAVGMLLVNLGFVYAQRDEAEPYADYSRQALDHFRAIGHTRGVAQALCNLGGALSSLGEVEDALACYAECLPLALEIGWRKGEALVLAGLGGVYCSLGELQRGLEHYARSREILEALGERFQIAVHDELVGRYLFRAGRWQAALEALEGAASVAEDQGYLGVASRVHEVRSHAMERLGDAAGALAALRAHIASRDGDARRQTEDRIRHVEVEHRVVAARREAELERKRSGELVQANEALKAALMRQQELQDELRRLAETDTLTGLCNRRKLREFADQEIRRGLRSGRSFAFLLLDVDHFKAVNDRDGHGVGDEVLIELAGRLVHAIRCVDVASRWGGEEFCVLLVDTDAAGARIAAERVRAAVDGTPFVTSVGPVVVTISGGLAVWSRERSSGSLDELLSRADHALYAAKRAGRNRIVAAR